MNSISILQDRIAFYTHNKIDRHIPKILGRVETISRDEIETRTDLSEHERSELRTLLTKMDRAKSEEWSKNKYDIHFLTPPDSPETLILPQDIENDLTSQTSQTKRVAFTQNQRYISLSLLKRGPKYTSELDVTSSDSNEE